MTLLLPSTEAPVRLHRNGVRNQSEPLSAFNRNSCPPSSESARFRRLLFERCTLRRCENQTCTCRGQVGIRIALARQGDQGCRECFTHFVGAILVCHEGRCSRGNIR